MSYHPCVSGCGRFLVPQDGHNRCLTCLGIQHAEEAFVDGSCSSWGDMTISELRNRLHYVKHGGVPLPRSGVRPGTRGGTASGRVRGDLRITVRASPSGVPHPSRMTAMLSRAAENVGLVWNPPPRPDPSRLDEWFLGGGRAGSQCPPPVPLFPEVHEELTILWKAPFTAFSPFHPQWWSCFGVHGHPLCGAVCGHATVSNSRFHSMG